MPESKPPIERDIRFWAVVFVIWICLLLGFMNIQTKISMLIGLLSNEYRITDSLLCNYY